MLPSIQDWLSASWADYRRRWASLMGVATAGFAATMAALFVPLLPAVALAFGDRGPFWLALGGGWAVGMLASLAVSTWAQAAMLRAASFDEGAADSLRTGWRQTPAFAWVLSLYFLAIGGGLVLLVVPGIVLLILLFGAPFYQLSGEDSGMGAVELSCARVRPFFGAAAGRVLLLVALTLLVSFIPWIGWLLQLLLAPLAGVALARLAGDLKTLTPSPERPRLRAPIAALGAVLLLATVGLSWAGARTAFALGDAYAQGRLALPDEATAGSMLAVLDGTGTDEDKMRSMAYVMTLSSAPAGAAR